MSNLTRKLRRFGLPKHSRSKMSDYVMTPANTRFERASRVEYVSPFAHRDGETPVDANARGVGYSGPLMADKGLKDGSCNRTACQLPLAGQQQWTIPSYGKGGTNGLYHYCRVCAAKFHEADREFGESPRCTLVK
jgi:hypothetical protein